VYPFVSEKTTTTRKIDYDDVRQAILSICKTEKSQDKLLIKKSEIASELYDNQGIKVNNRTIENWGVTNNGYFEKKYSSCRYNTSGNKKLWGLVIQPKKFIQEVEQ